MEMEYAELRRVITDVMRSREVMEALENTVRETVRKQMDGFGNVGYIERQRAVKKDVLAKTEKLLYEYHALEQHLASKKEYLDMAFKHSSGSVVRYQKNGSGKPNEEQILDDRKKSYEWSLHVFGEVKAALDAVSSKKGFEIIKMKYLSGKDYSFEEIAEGLAGTNGFSDRLSEKTVRVYKSKLLGEIALILFGADAI